MDDLISRQDAEKRIDEALSRTFKDSDGIGKKILDCIPSVKPRKGKWIIKAIDTFELAYGSTGYEPVYECSLCGGVEESYLRLDEPIMPMDADFPNFCPNCGARMDMRGDLVG